jgi:hypothetical protein
MELGKHKLDLVGVQVRWEKGGTERAGDYTFFSSSLLVIYNTVLTNTTLEKQRTRELCQGVTYITPIIKYLMFMFRVISEYETKCIMKMQQMLTHVTTFHKDST